MSSKKTKTATVIPIAKAVNQGAVKQGAVKNFIVRGGKRVYFVDPKPAEFDTMEICKGLSSIIRYCGDLGPYSVAQHSVLVAEILQQQGHPNWICLQGLYHDSAEFITGDICSPWKSNYLSAEGRAKEQEITSAIYTSINLPPEEHPAIKEADWIAFLVEIRDLAAGNYKLYDVTTPVPRYKHIEEVDPCETTLEVQLLFTQKHLELVG